MNTPIGMTMATMITTTTPCLRLITAMCIGTHRFAINTRMFPMPITGTGTERMGAWAGPASNLRRPVIFDLFEDTVKMVFIVFCFQVVFRAYVRLR